MSYIYNIISTEKGLENTMSLIQFSTLSLVGPARQAGHAALAKSFANASQTADSYRAITRLSLLVETLSPSAVRALMHSKRFPIIRGLDIANHTILVAYCVFEHLAVLGGFNVLPASLVRLDGCAVVCWFYNLLLDSVRSASALLFGTPAGSLTFKERRRECLDLIHALCFLVFSMTCIPQDGPHLLDPSGRPADGAGAGALVVMDRVIRTVAPKTLVLGSTARGLLGLVGTIVTFL